MRQLNGVIENLWPKRSDAEKKTLRITVLRSLREIEANRDDRTKMALSSAQSEEMRCFFAEDNAISLAGSDVVPEAFFPAAGSETPPRIAPERLSEDLLVPLIALLAANQSGS